MTVKVRKTINKQLATIAMLALAASSFAQVVPTAYAVSDPGVSCSTITLVSGTNTQAAGFTTTDPADAPASLQTSAYSTNGFEAAVAAPIQGTWVDPSTDANFTGSGAVWVTSDDAATGDSQWRLFMDSFTLPAGATVTDANISFAGDNAAAVYLGTNNTAIATTGEVYGGAGTSNHFSAATNVAFTPDNGLNILRFVTHNWGGPDGLIYKATINYCVPNMVPVLAAPVIVSPVSGSVKTQAELDKIDWSDVVVAATPVTYIYQASNSSATNPDGSFVTPIYTSGALTVSTVSSSPISVRPACPTTRASPATTTA